MKSRKFLLLVALMLSLAALLSACGGAEEEAPEVKPTEAAAAEEEAPEEEAPEEEAPEEEAPEEEAPEEEAPEEEAPEEEAAPEASGDPVTLRYMLWDANQLPAYEACAADFTAANPNITIDIEQLGWDDYWSGIQTGFVSGEAPDVFTNHLAKYPEFASKGQLVDIQSLVDRDNVDTSIYIEGLADLWSREGKRYGLPKDWDTIAVVYNAEMFEAAGVDPAVMEEWDWNPEDGGQFEEIIAQLTLDANGNNGLSPDFDPTNVVQHGFINGGSGGAYGQTEWSWLPTTLGFTFTEGPWAEYYNYEDPALASSLQWYADLALEKGYSPAFEEVDSLGANTYFASGKGAMTTQGSWMIGWFADNSEFDIGFGRLPAGEEGSKSMFNGLADSIWTGSENQEEAWQWVKYLASADCENTVGDFGVVFPAIPSAVDKAVAAFSDKGLDISAFTDQALDPDGTFLFPITDNASEILAIMEPTIDSILLGQAQAADVLPAADDKVDEIFGTMGADKEAAAPEPEETTEEAAPVATGDPVTLRYMLWDANQLPAYEACAADFTAANPNITIDIEQLGWDDYWSGIQTGFVSGEAPDVFTNHLAKYPEFATKGQLVDIEPWVERDSVDTSIYIEGLADLWSREGKRYGLPKDWDTIAVVYNAEMFEAAGVDPAVMEEWDWNPEDGGQFEEIIAQLTLDADGNNGLSPDFDPTNVVQHGFINGGSGGAYGQTEWSWLPTTLGFTFTEGPWAEYYNYEDPALASSLQWYADLALEKGYSPAFEEVDSLGANTYFASGKGAMTTQGSWMIGWFADNSEFDIGFGRLPAGEEGSKSMFNGLADSIWTGSENQEEAWQWVKYLSSADCENTVGDFGVVFPAIPSAVDKAVAAFSDKGLDISAFTDQALDPDGTFLFPITDNASEILAIMEPTIDSILLGQTQAADVLPAADDKVDEIFGTMGADKEAAAPEAEPEETAEETTEEAAPVMSGDPVTLRYMLWDANQLPAYEACAADFTATYPNITIDIEQLGWDDYWSGIQTGFVSGEAPDVFTNHLAKYPEFATKGQLVDIEPWVERDSVDTSIYIEGLADLWSREGKRYGLPKDWDTIAVVYNAEMFEAAGVDPAVMEEWDWNPEDGGQFEEIIAQLTLDADGNNGLSPDFDPTNVVQHGFINGGSGGAYGQTEWSWLPTTLGFTFTDGPWSTAYNYEDPALASSLQWYADLALEKGYSPAFEEVDSLGANTYFASGKGAMTTQGSWMIGWFADNSEFDIGFGRLPAGEEGSKSMFNGLADSIWTGSENQEEAWQWVKYLSSADCENTVGEFGVVFPAIPSAVDKAVESFSDKGLDISAFTDQALDPDGTFLFPITDNASEILAIMEPTIDSILLGQAQAADVLPDADTKVDAVFK